VPADQPVLPELLPQHLTVSHLTGYSTTSAPRLHCLRSGTRAAAASRVTTHGGEFKHHTDFMAKARQSRQHNLLSRQKPIVQSSTQAYP
jgi:hypothetical protein